VAGKSGLVDKLVGAGPEQSENSLHKDFVTEGAQLQTCWDVATAAVETRQHALEERALFHAFADEVSETTSWIEQKSVSLSSRSVVAGDSLSAIEAMQRGHDRLKQDVVTVAEKVETLCIEAGQLADRIATYKPKIEALRTELTASSATLQSACAEKTEKLFEVWVHPLLIQNTESPLMSGVCTDSNAHPPTQISHADTDSSGSWRYSPILLDGTQQCWKRLRQRILVTI
jgi:hypothetical protein